MTFMRKILGTLKTESISEMENTAKGNTKTEVIYHDRFDEEYREVNNYREITFNGRNFNIPEVQLCAAILLDGSVNGSKIRENSHYALYFEGRYGIMNISTLHRWLYEQGYLRKAFLAEALSLYKVPELKIILESLGLKKSGNKADLIERIINAIDDEEKARIVNQCEHLFVTEKGLAFLEENGDYGRWHSKSYDVTFEEFNKHRFLCGRKRRFYDTIFQALNEKAFIYQAKHYFSKLEMIYYNLSEVLYDEGKYDLYLRYILYRMYFSTNLASHPHLFDIDLVKYNGIEKQKEYIKSFNDIFHESDLKRVVELKEYYSEQILDMIYDMPILPYEIFNKIDLADSIYDLLSEEYFDTEHYINYICIKYENYINKFL